MNCCWEPLAWGPACCTAPWDTACGLMDSVRGFSCRESLGFPCLGSDHNWGRLTKFSSLHRAQWEGATVAGGGGAVAQMWSNSRLQRLTDPEVTRSRLTFKDLPNVRRTRQNLFFSVEWGPRRGGRGHGDPQHH